MRRWPLLCVICIFAAFSAIRFDLKGVEGSAQKPTAVVVDIQLGDLRFFSEKQRIWIRGHLVPHHHVARIALHPDTEDAIEKELIQIFIDDLPSGDAGDMNLSPGEGESQSGPEVSGKVKEGGLSGKANPWNHGGGPSAGVAYAVRRSLVAPKCLQIPYYFSQRDGKAKLFPFDIKVLTYGSSPKFAVRDIVFNEWTNPKAVHTNGNGNIEVDPTPHYEYPTVPRPLLGGKEKSGTTALAYLVYESLLEAFGLDYHLSPEFFHADLNCLIVYRSFVTDLKYRRLLEIAPFFKHWAPIRGPFFHSTRKPESLIQSFIRFGMRSELPAHGHSLRLRMSTEAEHMGRSYLSWFHDLSRFTNALNETCPQSDSQTDLQVCIGNRSGDFQSVSGRLASGENSLSLSEVSYSTRGRSENASSLGVAKSVVNDRRVTQQPIQTSFLRYGAIRYEDFVEADDTTMVNIADRILQILYDWCDIPTYILTAAVQHSSREFMLTVEEELWPFALSRSHRRKVYHRHWNGRLPFNIAHLKEITPTLEEYISKRFGYEFDHTSNSTVTSVRSREEVHMPEWGRSCNGGGAEPQIRPPWKR